jgi:hypothetical protein
VDDGLVIGYVASRKMQFNAKGKKRATVEQEQVFSRPVAIGLERPLLFPVPR